MINEKYTFPIHSFVDLITNSSTEIYISATEKTVESVKNLINNLLKMGQSNLTCDDLFTIEIDKEQFNKDYDYDIEEGDTKTPYDKWMEEEYHENYRNISLLVKCRDEKNPLGIETARILSNLTDMFEMSDRYDG